MLKALNTWFTHLSPRLKTPLKRFWYERLSALDRDADMIFMNYGCTAEGDTHLSLLPQDEPNRYCIQLYHRVASAIHLRGLDVLEVGSGRGGGASYVMRYLKPRSLTGLDCTARVLVKKNSEHHTAVQWTSDAVHRCPEFARMDAEPGGRRVYAGCDRLRASIDRAVREGRIHVGAIDGY